MKHQLLFIILLIGCLLTSCSGQKKLSSPIHSGEISPVNEEFKNKTSNDLTITDIDGNIYPVVKIGNKLWMASNLKVSKYNNGTAILPYSGGGFLKPEEKGMFAYYDNDTTNKQKYGKLYNFYAVAEDCLCPEGWHLPSELDWQEMIGLNGFPKLNLLPGGAMNPGELLPFNGLETAGYWWTSTSAGRNTAVYFGLQTETRELKRGGANEINFFSVRCVRD